MTDRRAQKAERHEQNKRTILETTAWVAAVAAALTVGLQAGIAGTSSAADVPRVTTSQYR